MVCAYATGMGIAAPSPAFQLAARGESCPRCDMLFSMIETTASGELVQDVETQERGDM